MVSQKELHGARSDEIWYCRALWLIAFVVFLPVAVAARLTGWRWQPWPSGANGYGSAIREADSVANRIVGITYSVF